MVLKQESVDSLAQVSARIVRDVFFFFRNIGLSGKDSGLAKTEVPYDRTSLIPCRSPQWKQNGNEIGHRGHRERCHRKTGENDSFMKVDIFVCIVGDWIRYILGKCTYSQYHRLI